MGGIDTKIGAKESEIYHIKARMAKAHTQFLAATEAKLNAWYLPRVREVVQREHLVTQEIGREKLASLKRDAEATNSRIPDLVRQYVGNRESWWHLNDRVTRGRGSGDADHIYFASGPHRGPDIIEELFKSLIGALGEPLEKYGYLTKPVASGYGPERLAYTIEWTDDMRAALKAYHELHSTARQAVSELEDLKRQKQELHAGDAWDSL